MIVIMYLLGYLDRHLNRCIGRYIDHYSINTRPTLRTDEWIENHSLKFSICSFQPENIVLKDRTEKKLKLIDFGLAKIIPPGEIVKAIMGTPEFVGEISSNQPAVIAFVDLA